MSSAAVAAHVAEQKKRFDDVVAGRIPRHKPAPKDPETEAEEKAEWERYLELERRDKYPTNWEATVDRMHQWGLLLPDDEDPDDEFAYTKEPEADYKREMAEINALFEMKDRSNVINPLPLQPTMDRRYYLSREYTEKVGRQDEAQGREVNYEASGAEEMQALYDGKGVSAIAEKIAEGNEKRVMAPPEPSLPKKAATPRAI